MRIRRFIPLLVLFHSFPGFAQMTFPEVDRVTYRLYRAQEWDSLLNVGKKALKQGIDYFYLRTRMGAARFEKGQYIRAVEQYRQARTFNTADPYTNVSLYYSLLRANRPAEAYALAATFPDEQKKEAGAKRRILDHLSLELGSTLSDAYKKSEPHGLMGSDSIYGQQDLYGNSYYGHLQGTFNLCAWVNITFGYSYLNFRKRKLFQFAYPEDRLDSTVENSTGFRNYYSFPIQTRNPSFNYQLTQHEVHLGSSIRVADGFLIEPAVHLIFGSYTNITAVHSAQEKVLITGYYQPADLTFTTTFLEQNYRIRQEDTSFVNALVSLNLAREFDMLTVGLFGSWSNLNDRTQTQAGFSLTYYPLGDLRFYGNTTFFVLLEGSDDRLIAYQMLGIKLTRWLWAEGDFLYGNLANGNLGNGMIVNNNSDRVRYRAGCTLIFPLFRQMDVALVYQFMARESDILYYAYTLGDPLYMVVPETKVMNYQTNSLFLGLKWKL